MNIINHRFGIVSRALANFEDFRRAKRHRIEDFVIDGYHFRAEVYPRGIDVTWLDCPDEFYPSGYSSVGMYPASSWLKAVRLLRRMDKTAPLADRDKIEEDIRLWLELTLADREEEERELAERLESQGRENATQDSPPEEK